MAKTLTPNELRTLGIEVLAKSLGPHGMVRFLQQFDKGQGDYTKARGQWLDQLTLDEIILTIQDNAKDND